MKFIYVFGSDGKQEMLERGYQLLYSKEKTDVHVFMNTECENYANLDIPCVMSDTLTF